MYRAGLIAVFCVWAFLLVAGTNPSPVRAEEPQPPLPIMGYDGLMQFVIANAGHVVLVNFWATWCGPCLKEMPDLVALREAYPAEALTLIGVSLDYDAAALRAYVQRTPLNFPNYHAEPELMGLLQIHSIPKMLIYDAEGHEVVNHAGYIPVQELRAKLDALIRKP